MKELAMAVSLLVLVLLGHLYSAAEAQNIFCFFNAALCQTPAPASNANAATNQPLPLTNLTQVRLPSATLEDTRKAFLHSHARCESFLRHSGRSYCMTGKIKRDVPINFSLAI